MRTGHTAHTLSAFPVYSSSFLSDDELVLGGGGGGSKSGVKNKLKLVKVDAARNITPVSEADLEDAPMSMTVDTKTRRIACGANSSMDKLAKGENENCRVFTAKGDKLEPLATRGTITASTTDDYQKVTVLSPDNTLLAVAGCNDLTLLSFPSLIPVAASIHSEKEIYDAAFTGSTLTVVTTHNLLVYALPKVSQSPKKAKGKGKGKGPSTSSVTLELVKTIEIPTSIGTAGCSFRAAKIHPSETKVLYTLINQSSPRTRQTRKVERTAYICKWDTEAWTIIKSKKISDRNLTCFDISSDGKFICIGSSDLSIGLLDASAMNPVVTILKAHEFPPTTLCFNPSGSLVVSGSADNTIRVITVPSSVSSSTSWMSYVLALIVIILAFLLQNYVRSNDLPWVS